MGVFGSKSNGNKKPVVGANGSRFATPANKIKKERKDNAAREAHHQAEKYRKGKHL